MQFDEITVDALRTMQSTKQNIFVTGKAGTGKSTLLKAFLEITDKQVVVLAPTWVAAHNVWGQTIHSFFHFGLWITIAEAKTKGKTMKRMHFEEDAIYFTDSIIIDEISMVRADMIDCIDIYLQNAIGNKQAFGGIQMIFIWDLYQLPPIVSKSDREMFVNVYKSVYFFDANVFGRSDISLKVIELQTIYRQSDSKFIDALNAVRTNKVSQSHLSIINQNIVNNPKIEDWVMYITTKNDKVESINTAKLDQIDNKLYIYKSKIKWEVTAKEYPNDYELKLKVWAQVMFVNNDIHERWVNGTLGKIKKIKSDDITVDIYDWQTVEIYPHKRNINNYTFDPIDKKLTSNNVWSFEQLPIKLCRACTIHKAQGKTFEKVIVDLGTGAFAHGQTYVALSRCTSLEWLILTSAITQSDIILDDRVAEFFDNI